MADQSGGQERPPHPHPRAASWWVGWSGQGGALSAAFGAWDVVGMALGLESGRLGSNPKFAVSALTAV